MGAGGRELALPTTSFLPVVAGDGEAILALPASPCNPKHGKRAQRCRTRTLSRGRWLTRKSDEPGNLRRVVLRPGNVAD